eukprot:1856758-Rhodomonas_salina.1
MLGDPGRPCRLRTLPSLMRLRKLPPPCCCSPDAVKDLADARRAGDVGRRVAVLKLPASDDPS